MINEVTLPLATNEEEVQNYYERVNEQMGVFQLEQQTLGNHTYYRWQVSDFCGAYGYPLSASLFCNPNPQRYGGADRRAKLYQ